MSLPADPLQVSPSQNSLTNRLRDQSNVEPIYASLNLQEPQSGEQLSVENTLQEDVIYAKIYKSKKKMMSTTEL